MWGRKTRRLREAQEQARHAGAELDRLRQDHDKLVASYELLQLEHTRILNALIGALSTPRLGPLGVVDPFAEDQKQPTVYLHPDGAVVDLQRLEDRLQDPSRA